MKFFWKQCLIVLIGLLGSYKAPAETKNYYAHRKYFDLCSFVRQCSYCESCPRQMYKVKIKNVQDKRIKHIYYSYYSQNNRRVVVREAIIEGGQIDNLQFGTFNICIHNYLHWAVSEIVYEDNTSVSFVVDGPLRSFHQEPDECDCNIERRGLPVDR